ncbi:MAG TPA: sodium:solute symporter [Gemmatimonadales bacterium]|nr:sodium:solute symporter [Gemmatimonadales bacterium]
MDPVVVETVGPRPARNSALHTLDLTVVGLYFVFTLGVGLWVSRHQRSASDYFLGARDLPAWAILLSIVATETSALTVISIPGIGARGDLTFLQLTVGYLIGRIAVARWLLPGYFRGEQETAYARLESRFGVGTRRLTSLIFLASRFLGDAVRVFASAIPLALITGWSVPIAIVVMGVVTMIYTWFGGFKAVVWTDVLQLSVYLAGGMGALLIAWHLAGGAEHALAQAAAAGKLRLVELEPSFTKTYTLLSGIVGGALLSAASHGADHLIVQRLLATRSLRDARVALVGSGVMVMMQFTLFLLVGSAIWSAGLAPAGAPSDELFPAFVVHHLPAGLAGLVIAGILAAAMGTHSSAINSLASSATHDLYASWTGRRDPQHLLRVGRLISAGWAIGLIGGALFFHATAGGGQTPVVVLALSIASVTYGPLLGTYFLAGRWPRARGRDVVGAVAVTVTVMLVVIFAKRLATVAGLMWLEPLGQLAWPWYVPLGTLLAVGTGVLLSYLPDRGSLPAFRASDR